MYKIKGVSRFLHIHMTNKPMHTYNQNQLIYTRIQKKTYKCAFVGFFNVRL